MPTLYRNAAPCLFLGPYNKNKAKIDLIRLNPESGQNHAGPDGRQWKARTPDLIRPNYLRIGA